MNNKQVKTICKTPKSCSTFIKVEHSFAKTPRELIERLTMFTDLNFSFCSLVNAEYFDCLRLKLLY